MVKVCLSGDWKLNQFFNKSKEMIEDEKLSGVWLYHSEDTEEIKRGARDLCIARGMIQPGSGIWEGPLIQTRENGGFSYTKKNEGNSLKSEIQKKTPGIRLTGYDIYIKNNSGFLEQEPIQVLLNPEDLIGIEKYIDCGVILWIKPEMLRNNTNFENKISIDEIVEYIRNNTPKGNQLFSLFTSCAIGQMTVIHEKGWLRGYTHLKLLNGIVVKNGPEEFLDKTGEVEDRVFHKDGMVYYESFIPVEDTGVVRNITNYPRNNYPYRIQEIDRASRLIISDVFYTPPGGLSLFPYSRNICREVLYDNIGEISRMTVRSNLGYSADYEVKGDITGRVIRDSNRTVIRKDFFRDRVWTNSEVLNEGRNDQMLEVGINPREFILFKDCGE